MPTLDKVVEVCFSPSLFGFHLDQKATVVVVDILRATSAICAAFANGASEIIPVAEVEEAKRYKDNGFLVAAERDGVVLDFADFGNSPFNFKPEIVKGKSIVYSTTNGTRAIHMAAECKEVVVGSFLNYSAVAAYLGQRSGKVIVFCSGWKGRFSLEDSVFAGALVERLLNDYGYSTTCDSAIAALDLWQLAKPDLIDYIQKAAQRSRLRTMGLDDVIDFCHTPDYTSIVPHFNGKSLIPISRNL
ncbi:2-phosphosulfolactate phosphatase [Williamwhitmania taraxaci]|uniref:Probable 2-phosphosulfolactate phosphatase n=1 Tax=Williamwhitmania taraxaci TaxID=1640674 RepID=A0A1G6T0A8_9BACT|nr:2-phosphosulfolactate phosphatase [Williamwhitmania taraxaci]SDD22449.1 2-phosphosulfolactate phosphatase [Williamwhitmania taraxaci]